MTAARPFRWLLALFTLILPASMMACHAPADASDGTSPQDAQSQVVFRHYI